MYDEGIDLNMTISENRAETVGNVRILRHVGADRIHIPALHHGIDGQRAPVGLSLAECERSNLAVGRVDSIERLR